MQVELFHDDNSQFFDTEELQHFTAKVVNDSSLIRRAERGDREAAAALKIGFWPFVRDFESAIDHQVMPRLPLAEKFGHQRVRGVFLGLAKAVREMKEEEGSHAAHWIKDARCLGLDDLQSRNVSIPAVEALVRRSYCDDLPTFFATLAGTEYIAEELSRRLGRSQAFIDLFSRKRWIWGEVHLAPHENGPSHLDIDLDLTRAYATNVSAPELEQMILSTVALFGRAADEVECEFLPQLVAA